MGAAAVLVVAAAAVVYAVYVARPEVPRGVTVLGVGIGGKSRAQAATTLRDRLAPRQAQPVKVAVEGREATVAPADVGLAVDVDATVARAARRNRIAALFGRGRVEPVVTVDAKRLVAALKPTADGLGPPATMPAIRFAGLEPQPVHPVPGKGLGLATTAAAVTGGWLRRPVIAVPITDVVPVSTAADVDRMVQELARPAVAAPVTVVTERGELTLAPEHIASSLVIDSDDTGKLNPHVDEAALRTAMRSELEQVETPPKNAVVGDGRIVASEGGTLLDTARLATDLMPVLPRPADRRVTAGFRRTEPGLTEGDLAALGIKEQVSTFTTYFSGGLESPRSNNIITGAREVDGAIVKPGAVFSLNAHTGPRGYAEGYQDAPIIADGRLVPGVGGGMSQFTTTLFNAAYYAGLEDVEHHPHILYFSSYPPVIEATIFYPELDLKFRNNTPYAILIDTSHTADSITVSMWSTRVYDKVTTEWGPKRDIVEPKERSLPKGPDCIPRSGSQGFAQDAWRVFHQGGKETKREKFSWRYDAEPRVTCH